LRQVNADPDIIGAGVWAGVVAYLEFLFSDELSQIATQFAELGGLAAAILLGALVLYVMA
jgi:membrane protein DedA with SNARE-associated domain|tara:strand:- start:514 stop:693 length:180 start_codon:yes stop_codon:yes gene_type:complete